jgi:hypothetical protein
VIYDELQGGKKRYNTPDFALASGKHFKSLEPAEELLDIDGIPLQDGCAYVLSVEGFTPVNDEGARVTFKEAK